ncbi:MAG: hypothetical protein IT367_15370 [Candidatus Hydrogenedentes bacterium]|nr:hypothetical protein [Candidatus Hydrogenedentota bacterium]
MGDTVTEFCEDMAALRLQLREAIWDGELEGVSRILDKHPSLINIPTHDFGFSPLMDAVSSSERTPELVTLFLERGADAKTKTEEGYTALHCAIDINGPTCHGQMPEIIFRMLLDAGADPFQRGLYRQNAIEHAEEQLIEVSEPEHKRKFGEQMEQIQKEMEDKMRSAGIPEEYINGQHAIERLRQFDSENRLRESLCAMRGVTR